MSDTFVALLTSADGGLILDAADYTQRCCCRGGGPSLVRCDCVREPSAPGSGAAQTSGGPAAAGSPDADPAGHRPGTAGGDGGQVASRVCRAGPAQRRNTQRAGPGAGPHSDADPAGASAAATAGAEGPAPAGRCGGSPPGAGDEFDDDDAENVAMYFADWSRGFAEAPVAGVIFDERGGVASAESWGGPILNTARHYGWPVGLRGVDRVRFLEPEVTLPVISAAEFDTATLPTAVALVEVPVDAVPRMSWPGWRRCAQPEPGGNCPNQGLLVRLGCPNAGRPEPPGCETLISGNSGSVPSRAEPVQPRCSTVAWLATAGPPRPNPPIRSAPGRGTPGAAIRARGNGLRACNLNSAP